MSYRPMGVVEQIAAKDEEIARLKREIEIRKKSAERFRLCPDHNGKLPIDGECVMCFTERNERTRNRLEFEKRAAIAAEPSDTVSVKRELLERVCLPFDTVRTLGAIDELRKVLGR